MSDPGAASAAEIEPRRRFLIPLIVGCAFFMEGLDSTMIAVSIPAMARSLGENPLRLNLVITTYLLSLAVFIPVSGWIADRFGARRVFCAAVLIFAGGSALCGLATSLPMLLAMRVVQGFGGAMMTPVGRLILLRSFPRAGLVSAMNWMTIPAMIGPTVGPIVGGFLTSYASWRWIFYLNIPIGVVGGALALWLFENYRAPAPARFDLVGFAIAGVGLFLLEFGIENLGRPIIAPALGLALFPLALVALWGYRRHARTSAAPVLDLTLLKIATFRIGTVTGGICRMGLDATPFLLPLLFQVGFGLSPVAAGLLTFASTLGAMLVRSFSRILLRFTGFRRTLVGGAVLSAAVTASFALLDAATPHWVIVIAVLASGMIRSIQYLALNTISFADVPSAALSRATSVSGVGQQLARGFGVAIGAALLALVAGQERVTTGDFRIVFLLIALIPLLSVLGFRRLSPAAGAEVSGNRLSERAIQKANQRANQRAKAG
ncbi:MAG TPA: MFS transporter [Stellaceae bacterium]|nr:MFS transporter [Stellaceae bacterium]